MSRATPTTAPVLHGRYRIEELLGSGRLANVYRAYDERLQRAVLVHMLRKELLDQEPLKQRFVQEAHTSARRSHQSLIEVFDSGEIAGRPYMITEYVAGRTLRSLGALAPDEALLYFRQIVGAVAACQAAGVPHPPITSNNVILVDEGHVELVESWLTPPAEIPLDIAAYRAPERTEGGTITPAGAVYALGLLLFEMLSGRRAISGDDPRTVAQAHLTARIPPLAEVRPTIYAPALEQLIRRATARRPEERPSNAIVLSEELDDVRRTTTGDTQRLPTPPARPPSLRQRINDQFITPRPRRSRAPAPVSAPPDLGAPAAPASLEERAARRAQRGQRSITGIVILLVLFVTIVCGTYYVTTLAVQRLAGIELPRPSVDIPTWLPDFGVNLPEWLTGVPGGGGEVLLISGADELRLRDAPGLTTTIIAGLREGERVRRIGGPEFVDNVPWLRVRANVNGQTVEGWLSANFLKTEAGETPRL
jgi:hypothetical protein